MPGVAEIRPASIAGGATLVRTEGGGMLPRVDCGGMLPRVDDGGTLRVDAGGA